MNDGTKIAIITIIWSFGTIMLAISIPLVKITQTGVILPIILIISVFCSTISVIKSI